MTSALCIESGGLYVGEKRLLAPFELSLPESATTAIIGKNGSGKSTLLKHVCGLRRTDGFDVQLRDRSVAAMGYCEKSHVFSWLPQRLEYAPEYSVYDLVMIGRFRYHRGFPGARDFAKCDEYLNLFDLEHLSEKKLREISGGELQRVALARAFVSESKYIILDEPFAGLDIDAAIRLYQLFVEMNARGHSVMFSVHGLDLLSLQRGPVLAISQERDLRYFSSVASMCKKDFKAIYGVEAELGNDREGRCYFVL